MGKQRHDKPVHGWLEEGLGHLGPGLVCPPLWVLSVPCPPRLGIVTTMEFSPRILSPKVVSPLPPATYPVTPEVRACEEALIRLCLHVVREAVNDKWQLLIGDDTSGRIPALVARGAVNQARREAGKPGLPIMFWPTSGTSIKGSGMREMEEALDSRRALWEAVGASGGRALIVTEGIFSGNHVRSMLEMLEARGILGDVATVAVLGRGVYLPRGRLYDGELGPDMTVGGLYQATHISGLKRGLSEEGRVIRDPAVRKTACQARADVRGVVAMATSQLPPRRDSRSLGD